MHANLRRYPRIGVAREVVEQSVESELLPDLQRQPGFRAYVAFWDEMGAGVSVSAFDDPEAAHLSMAVARRWFARHLDLFPERGEEFAGECITHEVSQSSGRGKGVAQPHPYVLVRVLEGVPATQDTRAFVQQRTLPMIVRFPGFREVYMARSDMDQSKAAVVTLFDDKHGTEACHSEAVALLKEGLPVVKVMQVVQGRAVIMRTGGG